MFNRAEFTCHKRRGKAKGKLVEWVASERKRTCVRLISRERGERERKKNGSVAERERERRK